MRKIAYSKISDSFKIDMIETTSGCTENCLSCGYYKEICSKIYPLERNQIKTNITQKIEGTDISFIDLFNTFVTTHVNTEPLKSDAFVDLAELTCKYTDKHSRVIAISHGVRFEDIEMIERLEKIVDLMEKKVVPLFVLSFDLARSGGKYPNNFESYVQTLQILKRVLGRERITVSIQGDDDPKSEVFIEKARKLFKKVISETDISEVELNIDERIYIPKGRAEKLNITNPDICDVIPDPEFIKYYLPQNHKWNGLIKKNGDLFATEGLDYEKCLDFYKWQQVDTSLITYNLNSLVKVS
ncbi:hypothetical protein ACFLZH_03595 [Patescibacteria group bacterium]